MWKYDGFDAWQPVDKIILLAPFYCSCYHEGSRIAACRRCDLISRTLEIGFSGALFGWLLVVSFPKGSWKLCRLCNKFESFLNLLKTIICVEVYEEVT